MTQPNDTMSIRKLSTFPKPESVDQDQYLNSNEQLLCELEFKTDDITVYFDWDLDGGGRGFGSRYKHVINSIYNNKKFNNCFEWCAGPGFIGFDLLSHGICDKLYLADIYKPALDAIDKTVKNLPGKYANKVLAARSKTIQDLPKNWKFDLVVANPPHCNPDPDSMIRKIRPPDRRRDDSNWEIHREFFSNIGSRLNDDGIVLLQESSYPSGPGMFESMINESGLKITECYWESDRPNFYYLEVKKK